MNTQEICQTMVTNALALLTMQGPMIDMEKNMDRLIETYLSEFQDLPASKFGKENVKKMLQAAAHMILEETKEE